MQSTQATLPKVHELAHTAAFEAETSRYEAARHEAGRSRLQWLYPLLGALVGVLIEVGLLGVRLADSKVALSSLSANVVRAELANGSSTYLYLALVLSSSLAILGLAIAKKEDALRMTSVTDSLTRVVNRRGFDEALAMEVARSQQADMPLALLVIDVDHFKLLNDARGHKAGDLALRVVADVLRVTCRSRDLPARIGGDEFGVLAPRTTAEEATILAERIRVALANSSRTTELGQSLSVSIGVADLTDLRDRVEATPAALLEAADRALYRAKTNGRGRVARLPTLTDEGDEDEVTAEIHCSPPADPCPVDTSRASLPSIERDSCAANTNRNVNEDDPGDASIRSEAEEAVSGTRRTTTLRPLAAIRPAPAAAAAAAAPQAKAES